MPAKRNYRKEYDDYHGTAAQKKRRAQRNKARAKAKKNGSVKKGDGKEVHHVKAKRTGSLKNTKTKVVSRAYNRKRQPKRSKG